MPGCVLRVCGELDWAEFLKGCGLQPYCIDKGGELAVPALGPHSRRFKRSGFRVAVCEEMALPEQFAAAERFLEEQEADLAKLATLPGVEVVLDFGPESRLDGEKCCVQVDVLPRGLVRLAARLDVCLMISTYPRLQRRSEEGPV